MAKTKPIAPSGSAAGTHRVTLGVCAGISIYKTCDLVRRLQDRRCEVKVVMTAHAARMVAPITFQALSGHPVITDLFEGSGEPSIAHIELARWEELFLVAPATANILGKLARGIADDFLTTHYLANRGAPVLLVPAMNGSMWRHPAVQENLRILEGRGHAVLQPAKGSLACGDVDEGRLPEPAAIASEAVAILEREGGLQGVKVLVTAGPTREPVDPVRFLSNRSSGKMGYAVAREAIQRGAQVTLVSGPTGLEPPSGADFVPVVTAAQMAEAVRARFRECQVLVMAAAVADYRAAQPLASKRKKGKGVWQLDLEPTEDILEALAPLKGKGQFVCGFAAETEELKENALAKLKRKGLDLVAANDVSKEGVGFESDRNALSLFWPDGSEERVPEASKTDCARALWDAIQEALHGR
ncbi:MAG: bifunctional phosphopantothenoylcysteine decarboxylase/phosphopantothenate--cysteine ligase CoaBC [Acidobacteriota bacterium]